MQVGVLVLLICTAYTAFAVPLEVKRQDVNSRFLRYTDSEGAQQMIDLQAQPDYALLNEIERNPANNVYSLYTRANPDSAQTLVMYEPDTITSSNFNPDVPTVVLAHGWLSNQNINFVPVLRTAFLDKNDYNIIAIQWHRLAISDYVSASYGVPAVGRALGHFLEFLHEVTGASIETMHLVGFGMGAHLVANAGRELDGRVARVTGLDPAGPLWNLNPYRIDSEVARYVEGIHTDGGYAVEGLGIGFPIGDVDFFANGGASQPGCISNFCNHNRSWELKGATITYNHLVGALCSNMLQVHLNTCRGRLFNMGNDDLQKTGSGIFRVDTHWRYPY